MYVFKTFVFSFDEVTPVLPIRQFLDLIKLLQERDSNSQPLSSPEVLTITY